MVLETSSNIPIYTGYVTRRFIKFMALIISVLELYNLQKKQLFYSYSQKKL